MEDRLEAACREERDSLLAALVVRFPGASEAARDDAVQAAMLAALERWPHDGWPVRPGAWLYRVAANRLHDELRAQRRRRALLERWSAPIAPGDAAEDDEAPALLDALFACCHPDLSAGSQLVLAMSALFEFPVETIARSLFSSEAAVRKRLARARAQLATSVGSSRGLAEGATSAARLDGVLRALYLLFNEGHLSAGRDGDVRIAVGELALGAAQLLATQAPGRRPVSCALVALMHLHLARAPGRVDWQGPLLLVEQDRSRWDHVRIACGLAWLSQSTAGEQFSRYHAEAGIAAEHCLAPSLAETRWDRVVANYALLQRQFDSPLHRLGHAVAMAHWRGAAAGLALLEERAPPTWLSGSYLWSATLAFLCRMHGDQRAAARHHRQAVALAPSAAVRAMLDRAHRV